MLHLTFAPNAHELLKPFTDILSSLWKDPFRAPSIIVPNAFTGQWLRTKVADALGSCIALKISTLETVLWQSLDPDHAHRLLRKESLQEIVVALLNQELLADESFAPVKRYLSAASGAIDPLRRIALASEISRLFLEYEYNRPSVWDPEASAEGHWRVSGVDKTWKDLDGWYFTPRVDHSKRARIETHEAWQKKMYRKIFGNGGLCGMSPEEARKINGWYLTLPQLHMLRKSGRVGVRTGHQDPVILFLISKVSHFHRNMLLEMSEKREVHLFLVNPCAEFWEDVATSRKGLARRKWTSAGMHRDAPIKKLDSEEYGEESFSGIHDASENQLLELWGASGKENIALWCQAAAYNFEYREQCITGNVRRTLLCQLQQALQNRETITGDGGTDADTSIVFVAAPDPFREIEALRSAVLSLLCEKPEYLFDDIIVYVADFDRYFPAIERVFSAFGPGIPGYIPFTYASSAGTTSSGEKAVVDLLQICDNNVTPAAIFSFLRNDLVIGSIGVHREEIGIWEQLAAQTGFCRGLDADNRTSMGDTTAAASDEHTFMFSQARLLLCGLAVRPVNLGLTGSGIKEGVEPFINSEGFDPEVMDRYCSTISRLLDDCLRLRSCSESSSPEALCECVRTVLLEWIKPLSTSDSQYLEKTIDALQCIRLQETLAGRERIPFEEFRHSLLSLLPKAPLGNMLSSGALTFAPLEEGYIIPRKAVFVVGMDSAAFPGMLTDTPFNLLTKKRIIGDVHRVRDNRYLFLELVSSALDSLYLSYQALDTKKDRQIQPSSVLQELATCLERPVPGLTDTTGRGIVPVAGYETSMFERENFEWDTVYARVRTVEHSLRTRYRKSYRQVVSDSPLRENSGTDAAPFRQVNIAEIGAFLRNPLEFRLVKTFRINNEVVDTIMITSDEPLATEPAIIINVKQMLLNRVLRRLFTDEINKRETAHEWCDKAVEEVYRNVAASGFAPEGMFADFEKAHLVSWVNNCLSSLGEIAAANHGYHLTTADSYDLTGAGRIFGHGCGKINDTVIDIVPGKNILAVSTTGQNTLLFKMGNSDKNLFPYYHTEVWLTAMLLAMGGCEKITVCIADTVKGAIVSWDWMVPEPWSFAAAQCWLGKVIDAMKLTGEAMHAPAIYFGEVAKAVDKFNDDFIAGIEMAAEDDTMEKYTSARKYRTFADVMKLIEPQLPGDREILNKVYRRLLPLIRGSFDEPHQP